jgi:hypothetical protein
VTYDDRWLTEVLARGQVRVVGDRPAGPQPPPISEKAFMAAVIRVAKAQGFLVFHPHDSRRSLPGYPDLTLCRPPAPGRAGQVIWAELKGDDTHTTLQQWSWLRALQQVTQTEAHLWRPADMPTIIATLRGEG